MAATRFSCLRHPCHTVLWAMYQLLAPPTELWGAASPAPESVPTLRQQRGGICCPPSNGWKMITYRQVPYEVIHHLSLHHVTKPVHPAWPAAQSLRGHRPPAKSGESFKCSSLLPADANALKAHPVAQRGAQNEAAGANVCQSSLGASKAPWRPPLGVAQVGSECRRWVTGGRWLETF